MFRTFLVATAFTLACGALAQESHTVFGSPVLDQAVPADYDGDGKTDLAVFRKNNALWTIRLSRTNTIVRTQFGAPLGDIPVPADYDGDGKADLAVYRRWNSQWIIKNSSNRTLRREVLGIYEDRPIPADYDGDGKTDIAVYRAPVLPDDHGMWILNRSEDGPAVEYFGYEAANLPVPDDYDGDGDDDIAYREASAIAVLGGEARHAGTNIGIPDPTIATGDLDGDGRADALFADQYVHSTLLYQFANPQRPNTMLLDMNGDKIADYVNYVPETGTWYWRLNRAAPTVKAIDFPATVYSGEIGVGMAHMTHSFPLGRMILSLAGSNGKLNQRTVFANTTSSKITFSSPEVASATSISVTCTLGVGTRSFSFVAAPRPRTIFLEFDREELRPAEFAYATVTLLNPAPAEGVRMLVSCIGGGLNIPSNTLIQPGSKTGQIKVQSQGVAASKTVELKVTAGTATASDTILLRGQFDTWEDFNVPTTCTGGDRMSCYLRLSTALSSNLLISLASNDPVIIVPASVTMPSGQKSVGFYAQAGYVQAPRTVELTGTSSARTWTAQTVIQPATTAFLTGFTLRTNSPVFGEALPVSFDFSIPTPSGGKTVTVASTSPHWQSQTVQVPAGVIHFETNLTSAKYGDANWITLDATDGVKALSQKFPMAATVGVRDFLLSKTSVVGGEDVQMSVRLTRQDVNPVTVQLSSNSSVIVTPPSIVIPAGGSGMNVILQTKAVTATVTRQITATAGGLTYTRSLTLTP